MYTSASIAEYYKGYLIHRNQTNGGRIRYRSQRCRSHDLYNYTKQHYPYQSSSSLSSSLPSYHAQQTVIEA